MLDTEFGSLAYKSYPKGIEGILCNKCYWYAGAPKNGFAGSLLDNSLHIVR